MASLYFYLFSKQRLQDAISVFLITVFLQAPRWCLFISVHFLITRSKISLFSVHCVITCRLQDGIVVFVLPLYSFPLVEERKPSLFSQFMPHGIVVLHVIRSKMAAPWIRFSHVCVPSSYFVPVSSSSTRHPAHGESGNIFRMSIYR
jgi:hypothetical protein